MTTARQIIDDIGAELGAETTLADIKNALQDGEALALLGIGDDDQESVEEAHAMVSDWIKSGLTTLDQV